MKKLRLTAAALLMFSCFSHFAEAFVYEPDHAYGSILFGFIFFIVGIMLFMKHPKAYWAGLVFAGLGLLAACVITLQGNMNILLVLHMAIDAFVIYVCANYLSKHRKH